MTVIKFEWINPIHQIHLHWKIRQGSGLPHVKSKTYKRSSGLEGKSFFFQRISSNFIFYSLVQIPSLLICFFVLFFSSCFAFVLIFLYMANVPLESTSLLFWSPTCFFLFNKSFKKIKRSILCLSLWPRTQPRYCSPFVLTCELIGLSWSPPGSFPSLYFPVCFFTHPVCFFTICSDLWTGLSWSPLRPSAYPQYKAKRMWADAVSEVQ